MYFKKNTHPWFRKRGYIHFDSPLSLKKAEAIVTNPLVVASHAFYPLIEYQIKTSKLKKDATGELQTKEKSRPIAYAAHLDSHIYAYYANMLYALYEGELEKYNLTKSVIAFRALNKSNIQFANDAFEDIKSRKSCSAVALDISGFFDNLNHEYLKRMWASLLDVERLPADHFNVLKSLTRFSTVNKDVLFSCLNISKSNPKKDRFRLCSSSEFRNKIRASGYISTNKEIFGIPQGSPISALLSNIYMLNFDKQMNEAIEELGGSYYRYCDDMLFIIPTEHRDDVEEFAMNEIIQLHLKINKDKTEKRDFWMTGDVQVCSSPLQYLGFTFDGQRKLIRSAALARYSARMKGGVKLAKMTMKKKNRLRVLNGEQEQSLYKHNLYELYSHLGQRNFLRYGYNAADIMKSKSIKRQLKPLWSRLQQEIDKPI